MDLDLISQVGGVFSQMLVAYCSVLIYMDSFPKLTHCLGAPRKVTPPPAELQAAL